MTINNFKINTILKQESVESSLKTTMNPLIGLGILFILAFTVIEILRSLAIVPLLNGPLFLGLDIVMALAGVFIVYFSVLDYLNTSMVITDKRIMFKSGVKRELYSIPLGKIQKINLKRRRTAHPGISYALDIIFKQEENFINSSHFKITTSKSADLAKLEELIGKIDEQFKFESGGKIEALKISSRKYLVVDLLLIISLLLSSLLIFF